MTICKMQDKPFDVLTRNKTANMTSVDWATQLVTEYEAERRKGWPTTNQKPRSENETTIL